MISVVITAYNADDYIRQSIDSILAQTESDLECIVIDDGSTDNTFGIAKGIDDPRMRVRSVGRVGRGRALNFGWEMAQGEYVAIQDADDISRPERLEAELRALQAVPDLAGIGSGQLIFTDSHEPPTYAHSSVLVSPDRVYRNLPFRNPLSHTSLMVRRKALETVHGYHETRPCLFDWDLLLRLYVAGFKLGKIDVPLVAHRIHHRQFFEGRNRIKYLTECAKMQARVIYELKRNPLLYASIPPIFLYRLMPRVF